MKIDEKYTLPNETVDMLQYLYEQCVHKTQSQLLFSIASSNRS